MSSTQGVEQAAATLVSRRIAGGQGDVVCTDHRPSDNEQAFTIQTEVSRQWCEQVNDSIGGWKCLQPIDGRWVVAPIFTSTINTIPPIPVWPTKQVSRIEPELAFYFAHDLAVRDEPYLAHEVDAAISRTHMALELIYNRHADPTQCTHFDNLADGLVNQGLFVGPQVDTEHAIQASQFEITVSYKEHTQTYEGKHPNGQPRTPLYWLVEFLRQQGMGIQAGQVVITGSYAGVIDVPLDTEIKLEYQGLGEMQVRFISK